VERKVGQDRDTVVDAIRRAVDREPDKVFLEFSGSTHTYADVFQAAVQMANSLRLLGLEPGERVVTILDNNVDAVVAWFAINMLGAINVPINTAYKGEFLRHQISDAGAKIIIAEADYAERVTMVSAQLPEAQHLLVRGDSTSTSGSSRLRVAPLDEHREGGTGSIEHKVSPRDLAYVLYTGGTTGPSKGCMLPHNYVCYMARGINSIRGTSIDDVLWTALPMFHLNAAATTVLGAALVGARASMYPRFSVSNFWSEVERVGATQVNLLGSMLPLLATAPPTEAERRYHGKLRVVFCAPSPPELVTLWKERFGVQHVVGNAYGLTEASPLTILPMGVEARPGSSGKRTDDFEVRIVDDEDRELPTGQEGEIVCRPTKPDLMFQGYWRNAEATLSTMRNLWFHTGDIGKFDEDGFFYFVDRKKDYLRRRGENVSSYEVEITFRQHDAIEDVAIHAVPSALTEDDIKLTAVLKEGAQLTAEELCRWSLDHLPYFAVPRYIEFRKDLPRSPVGRVLKYKLREEGVTAKTWDREKSDVVVARR
jgi:carnitine-CoA ligase